MMIDPAALILPIFSIVILSLVIALCLCFGPRRIYLFLRAAYRDFRGLYILIRLRLRCARAFKKNEPIHKIFSNVVAKHPNKIALYDISLEKGFTYEELDELSNRYANFLLDEGIVRQDVIALLMENSVHYVAAWLACSKIGVVSAWINTNLRGESLAHTLRTSSAKLVICNSSYWKQAYEIIESTNLTKDSILILGKIDNLEARVIDEDVSNSSAAEPLYESKTNFSDPFCFIYTSGTTGLPKAAIIKHFRFFYMASGGLHAFGVCPKKDKIYVCLPMYHTSAGVLAIGQTIVNGTTCVIRTKFSASNFWKDCKEYDCTVAIYIGELLRYLLVSKPSEYEKTHNLRMIFGNGLRKAVWKQFQERFNIGKIIEFYGSTEGTSNLVNIDGTVGACGFMTIVRCVGPLYPVRLFRINEETGELLRNPKGYLIPIRTGEVGALACTIRKNNPLLHFEGYIDREETNKKIIMEPTPGSDPVFISGDLLYWDRLGYFYFRDRLGDTFRWKGENVSTTEVEAVLVAMSHIVECTVYGVEVPGCEGKAGMAAIVLQKDISESDIIDDIGKELTSSLPTYAQPMFIRFVESIEKTGTFKMKKIALQNEGFLEVNLKKFIIYYMENSSKEYMLLTEEIRKDFIEKKKKL